MSYLAEVNGIRWAFSAMTSTCYFHTAPSVPSDGMSGLGLILARHHQSRGENMPSLHSNMMQINSPDNHQYRFVKVHF
jgi:hypothetical protein